LHCIAPLVEDRDRNGWKAVDSIAIELMGNSEEELL
jgi:hypothetical protein